MFDNIGGKIKTLAKVVCWLGIIVSVIAANVLFAASGNSYISEGAYIVLGIALLIGGPLVSWILSFMCYGFGELIENSGIIARNTATNSYHNSYHNEQSYEKSNSGNEMHKWRCSKCGSMIDKTPCQNCGYQAEANRQNTLDDLLKAGLISREEYNSKSEKV